MGGSARQHLAGQLCFLALNSFALAKGKSHFHSLVLKICRMEEQKKKQQRWTVQCPCGTLQRLSAERT